MNWITCLDSRFTCLDLSLIALTKGWYECAGIVCILAAAGDRGQQAVRQVVQQLNQELSGCETAQIQGSCKHPLAANCMQPAAHAFCLQVSKSAQ